MKKLLLSVAVLMIAQLVWSQQDAQYSQFFMNKLTYNPGFAGSEEKICATGLYRSQWVGFGSTDIGISPVTFVGNIHAPIGDKFGLGLNVTNDRQGFEESLNPMLSASYRLRFKNQGVLGIGLAGGFMQRTLAGDKYKPRETGDAIIPNVSVSGLKADFNLGLYYTLPNLWRFESFYAGLSASHLNQANIKYEWVGGAADAPLKLHTYFMTGASYPLSSALSVEPNILVKTDFAKTTADINGMVTYNNKIRGGLSYRTTDAIVILVGYKFTPELQIGYSYDVTTSNITNYSSGSHEIVAKWCFMPKLKEKPEKLPVPRLTPRFL